MLFTTTETVFYNEFQYIIAIFPFFNIIVETLSVVYIEDNVKTNLVTTTGTVSESGIITSSKLIPGNNTMTTINISESGIINYPLDICFEFVLSSISSVVFKTIVIIVDSSNRPLRIQTI